MLELEYGTVKFFDGRRGREFGFLTVLDENGEPTGEELFFHLNDGEFVETDEEGEIRFIGPVFPDNGVHGMHMWHPLTGEKLAFERSPGKNDKDKACPWTYADAYDNRLFRLTAPHYRVIKETKYGYGDKRDTKEVIWEGQDLNELSITYPVVVQNGKLHDPLARAVNLSVGSTTRHWFEVWVWVDAVEGLEAEDMFLPGHWETLNDPRERSEEARKLEAISSLM